jgi:hypothetical protein
MLRCSTVIFSAFLLLAKEEATGGPTEVVDPIPGGLGTADIYLDAVKVGTTSATYSGAYIPRQFLYQVRNLAAGSHTLKLVKTGGSWIQIDAFQIWP